ncbi:MAG: AAA-like domain-containing protein, partial [Caldilineaceae bacterium]|nr:AAA-like domain-containing protein [Caldilineaceae bacterium]
MSAQSDFFVAGGTLRPSAPSYVRRPADDDLLRHLTAGEFCYVLTPRQMGKSSLMVRTAGRLRADGHRIAIIDLTSIGTGSSNLSADQWYLGLLSRMRNQLRFSVDPQTWWSEHASVGHAQRFITFFHDVVLVECTENVVILIDEIDSTLNLSFRDDFFAAIRAIYNERATDPLYDRLTFALFGVATPTDLIQDRERTPFNIGQRVELVEFTRNDALPLQEGLDATVPGQGGVLLDRIFYWTGGHPYLTQRLCQVIANQPTQTWNDETIDALVHATFLSEEGRKDTNLDFVQNRIASSPEGERRQMLRLYRRVWRNDSVADNDRSLAQNRLELYGLVQVVSGRLWVRNRIYQQVFNSEWIDSLMPPQRQRRLALLTASVALVLLFVVWIQFRSQPPPQCAAIADLFTGSTDSGVRLDALANLFNQGDRCRQTAFDLFYAMEPAEHEALFTQLDDPAAQQQQLVTVIDGLYRTLDTAPEHDAYLMQMWLDVLNLSGLDANHALVTSIRNWKLGRDRYANDDYVEAAAALGTAVVADHPALYYDHALAMIANQEYDSALQDLNAIVEIAAKATPTPTPEVSATATTTPSPISSPTAALPATRSSATTTDTAVAPQSDGIMTITAIQQT